MASAAFLNVMKQNMNDFTTSKTTKNAAKPIVLILVLYGFAELLETKNFYSCPETGFHDYGGLFLFGTGALFFVLALLMNGTFWTSVTGCCREKARRKKVARKIAQLSSFPLSYFWFG